MPINFQSYTIDQRPAYPLYIAAKRYWDHRSPYLNDPSAITLIFAHATGNHKELWEPIIDHLYETVKNSGVRIQEMWSVDAPNHGDAFTANEPILKNMYRPASMWTEYGHTIHAFLTGLSKDLDVDFSERRLVGIGNCMGAVALLLSLDHIPNINFESLILCEIATMLNKTLISAAGALAEEVAKRRDIWDSYEEAYNDLKTRLPWKSWHDKVLGTFVREGLRPLPTPYYPEKKRGVTLKCTRIQEMACYADLDSLRRIYASLGTISTQMPVHMIYGAVKDYPSQRTNDDDIERVFGGLDNVVSFSCIQGAGHHVAQVDPIGLAETIHDILTNTKACL